MFFVEGPERPGLGVEWVVRPIPVVIMRGPILALVAILHAIDIHDRHHVHHVLFTEFFAFRSVGHCSFDKSLEHIGRYGFIGMLPTGDENGFLARTLLSDLQQDHLPTPFTFGEHGTLHVRVVGLTLEKVLEIGVLVGKRG